MSSPPAVLPDEWADHGAAVRHALRRSPTRYLVSGWPLRCWAHSLVGTAVGSAVLVGLAGLVLLGVALSVVGVGLALLAMIAVVGIPIAAVERRRLRLIDPVPMPDPHRPVPGTGAWCWLRTRLSEWATWRELGYTVLLCTVFSAAGLGGLALLLLSLALLVAPAVVALVAPDVVMIVPEQPIVDGVAALPFSLLGAVGVVGSAYWAGLLAAVQLRVAWLLLAPRTDPDRERVVELTRSRGRLVDAFEAERRRIERDLHDGAQQQLLALSMTLGMVRLELDPTSPATELVDRAHGEARRARDQLRELVRGIHPRVLTDHGLAAAVAEVALHSRLPVTVDVDLPHRLPGPVESTAYFTVTEALTNATEHSRADAVDVVGRLVEDRLVLTVTDNGGGGADPGRGTGLSGLADRVSILDGRLSVSSPAGGPTELRLEIPCSG